MARWTKAVIGGLLLCMLFQTLGFAGSSEGIRQRVVRLHVLAHDDSEAEQALKLRVRDVVSETASSIVGGTTDRDTALLLLQENISALQTAAQHCVYESGCSHAVEVELTSMYFTTRTYENGTYPAGVYDALRVTIGSGNGRNWWCVLYPPLCVSAATGAPTAEDVLTQGQCAVVNTPSYAVRFKVVEWWERLFH